MKTGVGSHSLLQGIFLTLRSEPGGRYCRKDGNKSKCPQLWLCLLQCRVPVGCWGKLLPEESKTDTVQQLSSFSAWDLLLHLFPNLAYIK